MESDDKGFVPEDIALSHNEHLLERRLRERFAPQRKLKFQEKLEVLLGIRSSVTREIDSLESNVYHEPHQQTREGLRERLEEKRKELHGVHGNITHVRSILDQLSENHHTDPKQLLRQIRSLPGVTDVGQYAAELCVRVSATYWHDDTVYDLGDWLLRFPYFWRQGRSDTDDYFDSLEVRTGRRSDWPDDNHPYYGQGDGTFCFGTLNEARIQNLVRQGNLLQAIVLATSYLCDVNSEDTDFLPFAFSPVKQLATIS